MKLPCPHCPHCNHHETESVPAAFYAALTRLPRKRASHPLDVIHDLLGVGPESPERRAQPERVFAYKVAPPQRIPYVPIIGCCYLAILAVTLIPTVGGIIACYLVVLVAGGALLKAHLFNRNKWPLLFEQWENSYLCSNCGSIFAPEQE